MLKKIALAGVGLLMVSTPLLVYAQSADVQAQIAALLAQIKQLQALIAQLQAGGSVRSNCINISQNLTLGSTGDDATNLQNFLISKGYLDAQYSTGYYGFLTAQAIGKLQLGLGIVSSTNDTAYGITGPRTRAAMACTGSMSTNTNTNTTNTQTMPTNTNTIPTTNGSASDVQKQDVLVGTGKEAANSSTVSVLYSIKLTDGTVIDSSSQHNSQPLTFRLAGGSVITGFQNGVIGMREGGRRIITIPPSLGYGFQDIKDGAGKVLVPANSTSVYIIHVLPYSVLRVLTDWRFYYTLALREGFWVCGNYIKDIKSSPGRILYKSAINLMLEYG